MSHCDAVLLAFAHAKSPRGVSAIPSTKAPFTRDQGPLTATSTTTKRTLFQAENHSPLTSNFEQICEMNCTLQ
jgi:hypothetical protein